MALLDYSVVPLVSRRHWSEALLVAAVVALLILSGRYRLLPRDASFFQSECW